MQPRMYTYEITIKRKKSRYLKNIPYKIMCFNRCIYDLIPGATYKEGYYSIDPGHTFKVVANTKKGALVSNEIFIPYRSDDVAFEIITEHDRRQGYSLKLVQVPFERPTVIKLSSFIGIKNKGILYTDHEGVTQTIMLRELHRGWKQYMVFSNYKPKYIGNYTHKNPYEINLYTNHPITINFFDASDKDFEKWNIILEKVSASGYEILDLDGNYIEDHLKRVKEKILHTKIMDPVLELFD